MIDEAPVPVDKCHGGCNLRTQHAFCHNCESKRVNGSARSYAASPGTGRDLSADKLAGDIAYAQRLHRERGATQDALRRLYQVA